MMRSALTRVTTVALLCGFLASTSWAQAVPAGSIDFVVLATPSAGRAEPGREVMVLLLTKSFADITTESEASLAAPNMDEFVDRLEVSPELKAWIKRTKVVNLSGPEFMRALKNDDIMEVPEFLHAYVELNAIEVAVGFPKPKYSESERQKDPVKYEEQVKEYKEGLRKFMKTFAHSRDGIDLHLLTVNPAQRWARRLSERVEDARLRALELAHTRYLAARAETGLDGRAGFVNVPAGDYWLSTLDREVNAGDVRLRWDAPVSVHAGQSTRIELNNYNALPRVRSSR